MGLVARRYPHSDTHRLKNTTDADIDVGEFVILTGHSYCATEDIVDDAIGAFEDMKDKEGVVSDFVSGEAAFAAPNAKVYFKSTTGEFSNTATVGYYYIGDNTEIAAGGVLPVRFRDPVIVASDVPTLQGIVENITERSGIPFCVTKTIAALTAGTAVEILSAAEVGALKVKITDFLLSVGGSTAWSGGTGTIVTLEDDADTPIVAVSIAVAGLGANAILGKHSTHVTLGATTRSGAGLTATKALNVVGDNNFGEGSTISVTVTGYLIA